MPNNAGVNRVFLVGTVENEPLWQIIRGERRLCFSLKTAEEIKKGDAMQPHFELHNIIMPPEIIRGKTDIKEGDSLYVQGKIQTRVIHEDNIKLYRCEILVTNVEHISIMDPHLHFI